MLSRDELLAYFQNIESSRPKRLDLRTCAPCKEKLLAAQKAMMRPRIAAVIPAFNEGERLATTVRCLLLESSAANLGHIIIVDDASTDGSAENVVRLPDPKGRSEAKIDEFANYTSRSVERYGVRLTVLRNRARSGVGLSRHRGGEFAIACGADVLAFMDAHVAIAPSEIYQLAACAIREHGIVQAACRSAALTTRWTKWGGKLVPNSQRVVGVAYNPDEPTGALLGVNACIGACYAIPIAIWQKLGGWIRHTGIWGFNEQALAIKAFFCGVPLYAYRDIAAFHYFKRRDEECPASVDDIWKSRYAVLFTCFPQDVFDRVWRPELARHYTSPVMEAFLKNPAVLAEREDFLKRRVRTDAEFFDEVLPEFKSAFVSVTPLPERAPELRAIDRWVRAPARIAQIPSEAYRAFALLDAIKPRLFLEIGSEVGGSAWLYAAACAKDATIILVDNCRCGRGPRLQALAAQLRAEGRTVHLVAANSGLDSTLAQTRGLMNGHPVDALHIDADHRYEAVKRDFELYSPLVRAGGLILLHDINTHRDGVGVPKFWAEISPGRRTEEIMHSSVKGIGAIHV